MDDLTGRVIKGYELRQSIGAGGFGAVFRAFQPAVSREVAVKVILPSLASQPDFIRRFETEAQLVARLEHPFIVPLFDYWRDPDGAYLVMRLFRGGSLRDLLDRERLSVERAIAILDQIGGALATAHRNNVIHRDLKPDNILLDDDGNAYLADFGIAKLSKQGGGDGDDEVEEGIAGSPGYMSPEQITLEPVTPQSDLYSLGVIVYEMMTGAHPFPAASTTDLIFKHLQEPLPDLTLKDTDLPPELNDIVQRATAKTPADRYPDVLAFIKDVKTVLVGLQPHDSGGGLIQDDFDTTLIVNPYKGLRAFEESDAMDFFGREALVQQLVARLAEQTPTARFLAVVGPSGSGKSSVVKAGLLPALRWGEIPDSERWFMVEMVPGGNPFEALLDALNRVAIYSSDFLSQQLRGDARGLVAAVRSILPPGGQLLLVIDQFEEVFTLVDDEAARTHFLALLRAAATDPGSQVRVVVTLRADFYDRPLLYEGFGALMRDRTEVVLPLSGDELERAITGPALRAGLEVEPALLAAIVSDVREEPGALPLLQYVLMEVFERRAGRTLTLQAYQASGGALGALARRADELYRAMDIHQQAITRQIFLRLVTLGEGTEDTRRRVHWRELMAISREVSAVQAVLDTFGKYRLLSFDRDPQTREPTVEVAHEALIREWRQLREWLSASREDVRLQRNLAQAASEWVNAERDASFLLRGSRLEQIEEWSEHTDLGLTEDERAYIVASVAQRTAQQAEEAARRAREAALEQQSRARLRTLVLVLALAFVGALILSGFALVQRQVAAVERDNAEAARGTSEANALTATVAQGRALIEADNAQTQVAIASTAVNEAQAQQAIALREAAVARSLALSASASQLEGTGNRELALALALEANTMDNPPETAQRTLARIAYAPGMVRRYAGTDELRHRAAVNAVAYSPDGTRALSASGDGTLIVWDTANGQPLRLLDGHRGLPVTSVVFDPDGRHALSGSWDLSLVLWDVETGELLHRYEGHRGVVSALAISPDGRLALSGSTDGLILWNLAERALLRRFVADEGITSLAISPDGRTALSGSQTGLVTVWSLESGEAIAGMRQHTSAVLSVAFQPSGTAAFSTSRDGSLLYWTLATGQVLRRFGEGAALRHSLAVNQAVFTPDGRAILTASQDSTLLLWDIVSGTPVMRFGGSEWAHTGAVNGVAIRVDGRAALSAGADGLLVEWDIYGGAQERALGALNSTITDVAFNAAFTRLFASSERGDHILWDAATGAVLQRFVVPDGYRGATFSAAFSPDGRLVAVGLEDNTVILWEAETGAVYARLGTEGVVRHAAPVTKVVFSSDNRLLASGSDDSTIILWDVETARSLGVLAGHTRRILSIAFSPAGDTLASGAADRQIVLWDLRTRSLLRSWQAHERRVLSLAYAVDGLNLLSASDDANLIAWELPTARELRRYDVNIDGSSQTLFSVAVSPAGERAVSGAEDGSLTLWNMTNGQPLRRLLTFRPAVGEARSPVTAVAFSPDGLYTLTGTRGGQVALWRTPDLPGLLAWSLENRYIPALTCLQRQQYSVTPFCEADTPAS